MADISNSVPTELPSTRKLVRSTIIAAVIASFLLVAVILPAEYGVDPTGIGSALGLTEMGRIKTSLAREIERAESAPDEELAMSAAEPAPATPSNAVASVTAAPPVTATAATASPSANTHETRLTLKPGEGKEIKLVMREGARVQYSWSTDRGVVNYDRHADSVTPRRDYHGYAKGTGVAADAGELVAAFDGSHGWFWRNRTKEDVTLTLKTNGEYSELKELK